MTQLQQMSNSDLNYASKLLTQHTHVHDDPAPSPTPSSVTTFSSKYIVRCNTINKPIANQSI